VIHDKIQGGTVSEPIDIALTCPACGLRFRYRSTTGAATTTCPVCDEPVPVPEAQ
jgi:hypothetical protein